MAVVSSGTTIIDNGAFDPAIPTGSLILLSTQTASASASIEFTSGIDSTYDSYVFKFINIQATEDENQFQFQVSTDGGSTYGVTITSTVFQAYHTEADTGNALEYDSGGDLAQSTGYQSLTSSNGDGSDDNLCGTLQLFNPSSTTYVKHFIARINHTYRIGAPLSLDRYTAGYINSTSSVDAIKFRFVLAPGSSATSGNMNGIIKMYGVK